MPPGPRQDKAGRVQSTHVPDLYDLTGMPAADIPIRKSSLRHLAAAIEIYKLHNDCEPAAYFNMAGTDGSDETADDINGTTTAVKYVFRRSGNPPNPEVIVHRDPIMHHTNYNDAASTQYYDTADVWDFFKNHPRVPA